MSFNNRTFWEGGPMKLTESVIDKKKKSSDAFLNFTNTLREQLYVTKDELDATIASIPNEDTAGILKQSESDEVIEDLETTVDAKVGDIAENDRENELKEAFKLQCKAAQYIANMKEQLKETNELNKKLVDQMNKERENVLDAVKTQEVLDRDLDSKFNVNVANRIQLTKLIAANPPPVFENSPRFGSAGGLLAFLNEEVEDYFLDICVEETAEKCRLLLKIFGDKSVGVLFIDRNSVDISDA